jgi:hypothetical protein
MTDTNKEEISFTPAPTIEIIDEEVDYICIIIFIKKILFSRVHSGVKVHLKLNNL